MYVNNGCLLRQPFYNINMKNQNINHSLRRKIGKAISNWNMISENDNILVGLSGGKDSFLLLHALNELSRRSPVKFNIAAVTIALTGMEITPLKNYCSQNNISLEIINHPILEIIKLRDERSPCSFCANMRRGIISAYAKEHNFNKLALGHTIDDAIETFLMNIFFTGRAKSFKPVAHMSRTNVTVIRPLVLTSEDAIINEVKRLDLPIISTTCPYAGHTQRQSIRDLIANLKNSVPDIHGKILHSLENLSELDKW